MKKILVFTATYNEYPNIKILIPQILINYPSLDIFVVDDNSTDGSKEYLLKISKKFKRIKIFIRPKKMGLNTAHKFAFNYAKKNYAYLITMDADLSHNTKYIRKIIKLLKKNDFVIGSRYMNGGGCAYKGFRLYLSYFGNKFIKFILGLQINEFTTSYRGFNLNSLKKINLNKIKSGGYSFFLETVFLINKMKYKIAEFPIFFNDRSKGKSKIEKIEVLRFFYNLFRLKLFY